MLRSFSSLTTVTALSFQSSMLCAETQELTKNQCCGDNKTLITTAIMTAMRCIFFYYILFIVQYVNLTKISLYGEIIRQMQNNENTETT